MAGLLVLVCQVKGLLNSELGHVGSIERRIGYRKAGAGLRGNIRWLERVGGTIVIFSYGERAKRPPICVEHRAIMRLVDERG